MRFSSWMAPLTLAVSAVVAITPLNAGYILYSADPPPGDIIFWDDSKLTKITLDSWNLNQKGPELLVDQIDNPTPSPVTHTYTIEIDHSYTKTLGTSVHADFSYLSGVFAEFGGLGAKIESQVGAGVTGSMSEEWSKTVKETKTETWCASCAKESLFRYALYSEFFGTAEWYYDDPYPGFTIETINWSARVNQGTGTRIQFDGAYTDKPCPEPTTFLMIASGIALAAIARYLQHR